MTRQRKVTFEKISEDEQGATYHVEAIHVTTTRNNRKYSKEELILGGRSLSYRPININHSEERWLPYNFVNPIAEDSNTTLVMDFDPEKNGVVGEVWITDKATRDNIDSGNIKTVSIEQIPTKGEACSCMVNDCTCEQNGIVFTGIGLLETFKGVEPGDPDAKIKKKEGVDMTIKVEPSQELKDALAKTSAELKEVKEKLEAKKECGCSSPKPKEQKNDMPKEAQHPGECPPGQHMVDGQCVPIEQEAFKCEVCGATFEDKDKLAAHMVEHQTERIRRQFLEAVERESLKLINAD